MLLRTLAAVCLTVLLLGCGSQSQESTNAGSDAPSCRYEPASGSAAEDVSPPPADPTVTGDVEVTISTGAGDLSAILDADQAPCAVGSFLSLAEQGYFDATTCHRLTTEGIFVLQCGDPTGTGSGGPGYTFADEVTGEETYGPGAIAMANAGPDTNGSQFFLVYEGSQLNPDYTVFGRLDQGSVDTLREVAARGTQDGAPDGRPRKPVEITGVTTG